MLMTAGLGTRLRPFTSQRAKPLLPVMGVPMAQFALDQLSQAGVKKVVANVHYQAEATAALLRQLDFGRMELLISDESSELLGSAGGIKSALKHLGDNPFFLMNADVLCDVNLHDLELVHQRASENWGAQITFALNPGISIQDQYREFFVDTGLGKITGLGDKKFNRPFWIGAAVVDPEALLGVPGKGPAEFVPTILEPSIRAGAAAAIFVRAPWYDIGSPELWWGAHMDLIKKLETGMVPQLWRKRIESKSIRLAEGIWTARSLNSRLKSSEWMGPCYFGDTGSKVQNSPRHLGPNAVYYGDSRESETYQSGIGFAGSWLKISSS